MNEVIKSQLELLFMMNSILEDTENCKSDLETITNNENTLIDI